MNDIPTDHCDCFGFVETCGWLLAVAESCSRSILRCTCKIKKVGLLMKLVEHWPRLVLQLICCKDGDAISRKFLSERGASMVVFESGDAWCDYIDSITD